MEYLSNNFFITNLNVFSNLPQNSDVVWDEDTGCFLVTKDSDRCPNPEYTVKHIKEFSEKLIKKFGDFGESCEKKELIQALNEAIIGKYYLGGLLGLAKTYINQSVELSSEISCIIEKLKLIAAKILEQAEVPEEKFSADDWEKAIKASENLPIEEISMAKYRLQYRLTRGLNDLLNTADWGMVNINKIIFGGEYNPTKNWWEKIGHFENGDLYLGAIPISKISGRNDLEELSTLGIGAVLSVVEVFENNDIGYITYGEQDCHSKLCKIPMNEIMKVLHSYSLRSE